MRNARLLSRGAVLALMALLVTTGACKKRLKLVDADDDKKPATVTPQPPPPPVAQNDPPPAPPDDPPTTAPAATEEPPPIIPAAAKVPVNAPKPITTTTAKPGFTPGQPAAPPAPTITTSAKPAATGKTFAPTCSGTCEKALKCMNAYSEVEHASCVVECSSHPVSREKLADLNSKDCATLVAMLKKK